MMVRALLLLVIRNREVGYIFCCVKGRAKFSYYINVFRKCKKPEAVDHISFLLTVKINVCLEIKFIHHFCQTFVKKVPFNIRFS